MTRPIRVLAVTAGLSQPSATRLLTDRLVLATTAALPAGGARVETEVVELRDYAADAVIAVSPIFRASYSGLFKSFFDALDPDALAGRPVLIAATGGSTRHALALEHAFRPLFAYLRALVVPTAVYAASPDWASTELAARITRAGQELAHLLRPGVVPVPDEADATDGDVIPFSRLLAAQRAAAEQR